MPLKNLGNTVYMVSFVLKTLYHGRYMKVEVRSLSYISDEFDKGNICPACPKV